mmetsp:Transcript_20719/g.51406  ORF Transcript_20719/g.51406 Transcript_20719/m.51406 type:complete len:220 (+) Transcript_20719:388-1047(+)
MMPETTGTSLDPSDNLIITRAQSTVDWVSGKNPSKSWRSWATTNAFEKSDKKPENSEKNSETSTRDPPESVAAELLVAREDTATRNLGTTKVAVAEAADTAEEEYTTMTKRLLDGTEIRLRRRLPRLRLSLERRRNPKRRRKSLRRKRNQSQLRHLRHRSWICLTLVLLLHQLLPWKTVVTLAPFRRLRLPQREAMISRISIKSVQRILKDPIRLLRRQ